MGEDSGEKTEEPTPHKLREARKKGQVSKSKDLTTAILMVVAFYMLKLTAVMIWEEMTGMLTRTYTMIPEEFNAQIAGLILFDMVVTFFRAMLPMFAVNVIVAILIELMQTGVVISTDPLVPQLNKLNPIEGAKKFFSLKQYVELVKSIVKMAIVISLIYIAIRSELPFIIIAQELTLWQLMGIVGALVMKTILWIAGAYFVIGVLDFFYQRYEYIKSLRMSKKEIKDEYKRLEGDPMIKQRQRDAQRQMAQGRQMGAVPGADVVVTNPTHIAVALKYETKTMNAPTVIAKGERLIAETIRQIAQTNDVPIVENKPLAQALFKLSYVDQTIPPQFYKAVAEILAFVYNLRKKRKQRF